MAKFTVANLIKLRERFPSEDDTTIARFLIARSNDLEKATAMLQAKVTWRLTNGPVRKAECIGELKSGKLYVHGTDLEGHPLLVFRTQYNDANTRNLQEAGLLMRYISDVAISRMGSTKSKYTILIDRTNHAKNNTDMDLVKELSQSFQDYYPETMFNCVLYPSDFIFYSVWNIVKWFLDPVTRAKVNPCMRLNGVRGYIADEFIPVSMGGSCTYEFDADDYPEMSYEESEEETEARRVRIEEKIMTDEKSAAAVAADA